MPRRPAVRILLLLVVAGVAIGIAGALFSGGETAARDPVATGTAAEPSGASPTPSPSPGDDGPAVTDPLEDDETTADEDETTADGSASPIPDGDGNSASDSSTSDTATPTAADAEPATDTVTTTAATSVASESAAVGETGDSASDELTAESVAASPSAPIGEAEPLTPAAAPDEPPAPEVAAGEPPTSEVTADEPPASAVADDQPPAMEAATQLIELLRPLVAAPDANVPDYDRDHFAGWLDADGDCVNTRHEILQAEAVDFSMNASGCAVASGEWFDSYTNRTFTDPLDLDVDHVVALADAWVSGAWRWADELLDRFSNDLGNLNAIAAGENRSKSAKGPAEYSPSEPAARCGYLVQYATVKIDWSLSITPQDFEVVATGLQGCEVGELPGDRRPAAASLSVLEPPSTPTTTISDPGCHPAYEPCLPNLPGDALNCGDLGSNQKPVTVIRPGTDPYRLDRDGDGFGCTS